MSTPSIRVRRYRWGYSPCYLSETIDRTVHRALPAVLRHYADRLEDTSPRWGWRARLLASASTAPHDSRSEAAEGAQTHDHSA